MMTFRKVKTYITPNNAPDGGVYSSAAFPQINFVIAKVPGAYVDPRTLSLTGKIRILDNNGDLPSNVTDGFAATAFNGVATSPSVSVHSIIDEVALSTLNGRSIETIRSYNRYVATTRPFYTSSEDVTNGGSLYDAGYQVKSVSNALTSNQETDFAISLRNGLLANQIIPISEKGLHGLNITLSLAQNSQVLQPFFIYDPASPTGSPIDATTAGGGFRYEVFDLALQFDMLIMSQALSAKVPSSGVLGFNTVQTMHSTLLSSDQSINLRFGTKNTLSVTHSIIPSLHLNNIQTDSMRLCEPENNPTATGRGTRAPITQVQYLKGGRLFPYDFPLISEAQAIEERPTSMITEPAQNSVTLYETDNSMLSTNTFLGLTSGRLNLVKTLAQPYSTLPDPRSLFILGVPMDSQRTGVDFSSEQYTVRIQSSLNQRSPQSLFSFTLARNLVTYNPTGIMVIE